MRDESIARLVVPVGPDDHVRGNPDAPVTLVEYGDFQCPYCGQAFPMLRALEEKYGDRLRVVFRNFPLTRHPHAEAAAEATEFAADHGKFWELHDLLYQHQDAVDEASLLGYAREIGLDSGALALALREQTYRPLIDEVKEGAEESGIPGTPAFFLNEVLFEGDESVDGFSEAIDWLLAHDSAS
ncbi:MAG TPA: thioredoxin domain-containing protein [Candidatus Limnocylindria bacterium]|jgi:protein-disulfide isomerase|nr:thioredoxin domain-containing protein [Candidatus Limnocylindria bacterium]